MLQNDFEALVKELCKKESLPEALQLLKTCDDSEVSEVAESLTGQFALAEVEGEKRIYHVTLQENDSGEEEEFVEHIMNEGEDVIYFVAWFFSTMFDMKQKDVYQIAGKTFKQRKKS